MDIRRRRRIEASSRKKRDNKLRILDWYVHQGHQYEFFKTGHDFFLIDPNASRPKWNAEHRPLNENVHLVSEVQAQSLRFDFVMVRSPLNIRRYRPFIRSGATPIGVVQTTTAFQMPKEVRHIVWNSYDVMRQNTSVYRGIKNYYIVHGYDPEEFVTMDLEDNGRILTVANSFMARADIMGYPLLKSLNDKVRNIDIMGHDNENMENSIGEAETLQGLIEAYNRYSIYLNTTKSSAMPRSRAEAAMCGSPIVTTNNFGIDRYFQNGVDAIVTNDEGELYRGIKMLMESESMREEFGHAAREVAIKNFNLKDYLEKWNSIFTSI